ncbi:hypothetical protein BDEG_21419 [Batrachochytrium dendrobatidis JEL423]|uniref:Uncharacterized protein n=1 Tax=Batrachochytrium dendrobatidis (strain JEL423) TaxID=403673 RepID=A0A177WBA9_BATDL|nr:hypothetical protein BDEG_21419 [Batrachochytrium dendrobatidis JEL423]
MTIESDSDDDLSGTPSKKWTMVCRTIKDWETWPERFQASTHPDERALYKYLTLEAKPHAISQIKKWNTVRNLSEALQNRKRSTRLQIRELTDSESMYNGVSSRSRRQTRATENTGNSSLNLVKRLEEESRRKEAVELSIVALEIAKFLFMLLMWLTF